MAYDAKDVADYFIDRGKEEGMPVTPMKLLKLVYFAQGWHLALKDEELFDDPVEAWDYGPVIPSVYHAVKRYGDEPIKEHIGEWKLLPWDPISDDETKEILDAVWESYSKYAPEVLSDITHMHGTPWHDLYEKFDGHIPRHKDISNDRIKEHFEKKLDPEHA